MNTATQTSIKASTVTTFDLIPGKSLLYYHDLPTFQRWKFDSKVARVRALWFVFGKIGLFLKLEGSSRIYDTSYKGHPDLKHRVIPPKDSGTELPPLFLDIHGGGYIQGKPWHDDEPNLCLASTLNCLVVSMDYSKSPEVQFPGPTNELVDTVLDILADSSLRFDRSRVVIGGYSAGGNLCLSVAQSPLLRDKIHGVVAWYPPTNMSTPRDEKAASRPYPQDGEVDGLKNDYDIFMRAYLPPNSLLDPRASVGFAERETLPKHLLIVGAELDMLCKEAAEMAGKYAGVDVASLWDTDVDEKFGFEAEGIRWICVRNSRHGFTHTAFNFGEEGRRKTQVARLHYEDVCCWLSKGPFSSKNTQETSLAPANV